jgi:hypothetical protein
MKGQRESGESMRGNILAAVNIGSKSSYNRSKFESEAEDFVDEADR